MPRKFKYPNNEETPVFDSDIDPFEEDNEAPLDIIEKVDKGEVDTRCTCAIKRNPKCATHLWNDRNK
jgi:hypothetical protein